MKNYQKGFVIPLLIIAIIILIAGGGLYFYASNKVQAPSIIPDTTNETGTSTNEQPVACTMDAKQCSDGTYVGRTGPNCEFVCPEEASTTVLINSISPTSGPIGTLVTVLGKNLSGFEGDKNLWIENSNGQKGIIVTGGSKLVNTDTSIRFILGKNYCTIDTTYSGLPCPSLINITPGIYIIYASPWGKNSNKVQFTVTQ